MSCKFLLYGVLMIVLSVPLGGCLDVATSKMNRGPTAPPPPLCRNGIYTARETVGYGCTPTAPAAY